MVLSARVSTSLAVCVAALALAAFMPGFASAQTADAPVQTYVDQALPSDVPGVMPEGMEWNHPMKAGDMVLPRKTQPKPRPAASLQAPTLSKASPPQIASDANSTASVMLLQGMKNALQQAGENPSIPKSSDVAAPATGAAIEAVLTSGSELAAPVIENKSAPESTAVASGAPTSIVPAADSAQDVTYQPGRGPKTLAAPKGASPVSPAATPAMPSVEGESGASEIVFPPEMAEPAPSAAPAPVASGASIFGEPVKEEAEAPTDEDMSSLSTIAKAPPAPEKPVKQAKVKGKCTSSVTKWTRDCQDAGYPAHFVGQIVGETRIVCPSGDAKDVWLSNSCAAPVSGETAAALPAPAADAAPVAATESETQAAVVVSGDDGAPLDGSCGVANGLAANVRPMGDLCARGDASPVSGEGPWRWNCKGRHGGMTVSCAAPMALKAEAAAKAAGGRTTPGSSTVIEDGKCGAAAQQAQEDAPTKDLCDKGTPSRVNGGGPWTWACSGLNGGQAAACTASRKIDGACGTATREGSDGMPTRDLCAAGYASAVTGEGPWNWTCSGLNGGAPAVCSAQPKVNAVCGPAAALGHRQAPQDGLCHIGAASSVEGKGPWTWTCAGKSGGASVSCSAGALTDGMCGAANGAPFDKAPTADLCASGHASRVTGQGPWTWTCAGEDGGDTASCTAMVMTKEALAAVASCGTAAETPSLFKPGENLCAAGTASAVAGEGPWTWSCSDGIGHSAACSTLTASEGACGAAANVASSFAPTAHLCAGGTPSEARADKGKGAWVWDCAGGMGGNSVTCSAPISQAAAARLEAEEPAAKCGLSAGQTLSSLPEVDLCAAGKASPVRGRGPWTWSCTAPGKKGVKVDCEASKLVDGACGSANGSVQRAKPGAGLCVSGEATAVAGTGPWTWSCVGTSGGSSASCSALSQAQTKVDGTCGAASGMPVTAAPESNLCDSGTPSSVYGEGPWTWTCSGLNGGIASTCNTVKIMAKAPPPPGPSVNGLCGPANGVAALAAPEDGLCSTGTATAMSGQGPWNWSCIGSNGGMTVSCTAPLMPPAPIVGACGAASGVPTLTAPKSGLCSAGIVSAVSGKGPWTWSCSGTNGGGAVSCVAPVAGSAAAAGRPLPSLSTPSLDNGEAPAPRAAPAGLVTPTLPSKSMAPLGSGTIANRKTIKSGKSLSTPKAPLVEAPLEAPTLPEGVKALTPPGGALPETPGLEAPVTDSQGKTIPGARLILEPSVSTLSFKSGSDQLDQGAVDIAEKLAAVLMAHDTTRITLTAYADTNGDRTPREARRLSLSRALAVRDFLASKGVASNRVDVRPMGSNVPSGDMDRVDVRVN